jgi:hypothetical protein
MPCRLLVARWPLERPRLPWRELAFVLRMLWFCPATGALLLLLLLPRWLLPRSLPLRLLRLLVR